MFRTPIALAVVVVGIAAAPLGAAASGTPTDPHPSKQEARAMMLRGEALNRIYGTTSATGPTQQEVRAYTERGQALNRIYRQVGPSSDEVRALTLRGEALNRSYHGGAYTTGSSFAWRSVELTAVAVAGAIVLAFAAAVGVRKRRAVIAV
jgi:hypothetical protein